MKSAILSEEEGDIQFTLSVKQRGLSWKRRGRATRMGSRILYRSLPQIVEETDALSFYYF
jgi:hypothetical protein